MCLAHSLSAHRLRSGMGGPRICHSPRSSLQADSTTDGDPGASRHRHHATVARTHALPAHLGVAVIGMMQRRWLPRFYSRGVACGLFSSLSGAGRGIAALSLALLTLGCHQGASASAPSATGITTVGARVTPGRGASTSSQPSPVHHGTRWQVGVTNAGETIRVKVGDTVVVRLPGGADGGFHWPASTSGAVQRQTASGGYPSPQPVVAHFVAARKGRADLQATNDFTCFHATPPCLPPQDRWLVHLVVRGSS